MSKKSYNKGNNFAQKWTVEKARKFTAEALSKVSKDCYILSHVADEMDSYRDVFRYIMDLYKDDEEVFTNVMKMRNKCERYWWELGTKNEIDKTLAIFGLKSLHGLMEASKHYNESVNKNINYESEPLTQEEIEKVKDKLEDKF
ncbi:hypothetical protein [Tenacibaculum phage JQ]|nr:hypothetical protein [Tenacibaculum phage JQ]